MVHLKWVTSLLPFILRCFGAQGLVQSSFLAFSVKIWWLLERERPLPELNANMTICWTQLHRFYLTANVRQREGIEIEIKKRGKGDGEEEGERYHGWKVLIISVIQWKNKVKIWAIQMSPPIGPSLLYSLDLIGNSTTFNLLQFPPSWFNRRHIGLGVGFGGCIFFVSEWAKSFSGLHSIIIILSFLHSVKSALLQKFIRGLVGDAVTACVTCWS